MHSNYRGIAFLLSLGSLPLACAKEGNDTDSDGSTGNPATTTGTTGNTATDPTGTSTSTDPTTTTTGTDATTTTTSTGTDDTGTSTPTTPTTTDTDSDTGEDTELPPPTDPICIAYAERIVECVPRYDGGTQYLAQYCEYTKGYGLQADGQGCLDAINAFYVCISKVDCADFEDENANPCAAEMAARTVACPTLYEVSTDTDMDTGEFPETTGDTTG